ncbi:hypothetical protein CQ13_09440 [Bradyrhizobium retamae]|uniref:Uncharacterized protein n=1 Tax=Bradyrhizobium retamae TaxID=1300035 RepID=A0A0R3MP05_9BRAD|nr:hypothetical protein CQ13_09440 [Bradyrhizobium retamae]
MILKRKRQRADAGTVEVDRNMRMPFGKQLESHNAKFKGSSRYIRFGVEYNSISDTVSIHNVIGAVAAEIERVRRHSVLCPQLFCKKSARSDRMKAHAIGMFCEDVAGTRWMKPWLKILDEIETHAAATIIEHRVCGRPCGCHDSVSVSHAAGRIVYFPIESRKIPAYAMTIIGGIASIHVIEVDAADISGLLQVLN